MSIVAHDLGVLAAQLAEGTTEVEWRSGVSRAYYAAYHAALYASDLCPSNAHLAMGAHERLANRFEMHPSKGAKSIAIVLTSMKRFRHIADYDISDPFDQPAATNQVAQLKALTDRISAFENTHRPKEA